MLETVLLGLALGVVLLAAWYSSFLHFNHRRGWSVLRWLEQAVAPYGLLGDVCWVSPCRFRARLNLHRSDFHQPSLDVRLAPRHMPLLWAWWSWRRRQETLTFQANLPSPPGECLEIGRNRWSGPSRSSAEAPTGLHRYPVATLYLSTQPTWKPEVIEHMGGALSIEEFDFLAVSFRPRKPHFSVTFALHEALRRRGGDLAIFDSLRELASGPPTSRS
jgi:hypothetical protein